MYYLFDYKIIENIDNFIFIKKYTLKLNFKFNLHIYIIDILSKIVV